MFEACDSNLIGLLMTGAQNLRLQKKSSRLQRKSSMFKILEYNLFENHEIYLCISN